MPNSGTRRSRFQPSLITPQFILFCNFRSRLANVDDAAADALGGHEVGDRIGALRDARPHVQEEGVVDAGVVIVPKIKAAFVGPDRLIEIPSILVAGDAY
jgi:hypothetical protein